MQLIKKLTDLLYGKVRMLRMSVVCLSLYWGGFDWEMLI